MNLFTLLQNLAGHGLRTLLLAFFCLILFTSNANAQDGAALDFDGMDDNITIGDVNLTIPFTIEVWVKPNQKTDFSTIISNKTGGIQNSGYSFAINSFNTNDGKLILETSGVVASTDEQAITWGEWQHIAVTTDGTTAKFYVNGIEQIATENEVVLVNNIQEGHIGDFNTYNGNANYNGQMDELNVWGYARSQAEIQDQMQCELVGSEFQLFAYFNFNQGTANGDNTSITYLEPKTGPTGTLRNFVLTGSTSNFVTPGGVTSGAACNDIAGGSLDFDGISNFSSTGTLQLDSAFTIEAWVKPTEKTSFSTIISNKTGGLENPGYNLSINSFNANDGKLVLETENATAQTDNSVITWGEWQHIAVTTDGVTAQFYVNGVEQAATLENIVSLAPSPNTTNIGDFFLFDLEGKYSGRMDELRVWNFAKSQDQIMEQMNCELVGDNPELLAYYDFNQGIAASDNTSITELMAVTGPNGTLSTFALNGSSGNFVAGEVEDTECAVISNTEDLANALLPMGELFPNPIIAGTAVQVSLNASEASTLDIQIFNSVGQLVHMQQQDLFSGAQMVNIESTRLPIGIYWVQFNQEGRLAQRKLVVN